MTKCKITIVSATIFTFRMHSIRISLHDYYYYFYFFFFAFVKHVSHRIALYIKHKLFYIDFRRLRCLIVYFILLRNIILSVLYLWMRIKNRFLKILCDSTYTLQWDIIFSFICNGKTAAKVANKMNGWPSEAKRKAHEN